MVAENDSLITEFEGLERTVRKIERHYGEAAKPIAPHATPVAVTATAKAPVREPSVSKLRLVAIKPEMEEKLMDDPFLKKITMGSRRGPDNIIEILDASIQEYSKHGHPLFRLKEYELSELQHVYEIDTVGPDITDVPEETNKLIGKIAPVGVWKNMYLTIIPNVTNSKRTKEANVLALVKNMNKVRVRIKNPKATPVGKEVTAYNTPWVADAYMPSAWIEAGSKIIVEAIKKATKMLVDNPTALDGFKNIEIPISSLVDVVPGLKGQPIDVTAMGTERMGQYDSPIVSFSDAEDGKIDCRLGIHWTMKEPIREDKPGEAWYGTVRLYVEYYPKSMGKKNKWNSHVRAEYERSDDEELDDKFEGELKKLVEEDKDHRFTFDVPSGKEALKIAEKVEFTGFSR